MLRRFADHRLRRDLDRARAARDDARQQVRVLRAELEQAHAAQRDNYRLAQQWKAEAHRQAAHVAELRAEHRQETTP